MLCGGFESTNSSSVSKKCYRMVPGLGYWSSSPPMSLPRARSAYYADGTVLIVAGGTVDTVGTPTNTVEKFDGTAWVPLGTMPAATKGY